MEIVIQDRIDDALYVKALDLIHRSFEEHINHGIVFTCSNFTLDDLKKKTDNGYITTVLLDRKLIGFHYFSISGECAYGEFLAINPEYKRQGIASEILRKETKFLLDKGIVCLIEDTSADALSSVKYHLKNGYRIVGFASYRSTDYYSLVFRKQLVSPSLWNSVLWCECSFVFSFIRCRLMRKRDGSYTFTGKALKAIKLFIISVILSIQLIPSMDCMSFDFFK